LATSCQLGPSHLAAQKPAAPADAEIIEITFQAKLDEISNGASSEPHATNAPCAEPEGVIAIGKPVRERDRDHLRFVASQPCLVCGRIPSDPHHIKFAEQRAMGRKVSDKFTVPICRLHHRELHRRGNERAWWTKKRIDPLSVAASLWKQTHAGAEEAGHASDVVRAAKLNGHLLREKTASGDQNNETKPILRREAP
jgi:hypothetical protein